MKKSTVIVAMVLIAVTGLFATDFDPVTEVDYYIFRFFKIPETSAVSDTAKVRLTGDYNLVFTAPTKRTTEVFITPWAAHIDSFEFVVHNNEIVYNGAEASAQRPADDLKLLWLGKCEYSIKCVAIDGTYSAWATPYRFIGEGQFIAPVIKINFSN